MWNSSMISDFLSRLYPQLGPMAINTCRRMGLRSAHEDVAQQAAVSILKSAKKGNTPFDQPNPISDAFATTIGYRAVQTAADAIYRKRLRSLLAKAEDIATVSEQAQRMGQNAFNELSDTQADQISAIRAAGKAAHDISWINFAESFVKKEKLARKDVHRMLELDTALMHKVIAGNQEANADSVAKSAWRGKNRILKAAMAALGLKSMLGAVLLATAAALFVAPPRSVERVAGAHSNGGTLPHFAGAHSNGHFRGLHLAGAHSNGGSRIRLAEAHSNGRLC